MTLTGRHKAMLWFDAGVREGKKKNVNFQVHQEAVFKDGSNNFR